MCGIELEKDGAGNMGISVQQDISGGQALSISSVQTRSTSLSGRSSKFADGRERSSRDEWSATVGNVTSYGELEGRHFPRYSADDSSQQSSHPDEDHIEFDKQLVDEISKYIYLLVLLQIILFLGVAKEVHLFRHGVNITVNPNISIAMISVVVIMLLYSLACLRWGMYKGRQVLYNSYKLLAVSTLYFFGLAGIRDIFSIFLIFLVIQLFMVYMGWRYITKIYEKVSEK